MKKIVLIDFDAAIGCKNSDGQQCAIKPGSAEAIHELRSNGYEVHVFSPTIEGTGELEKKLNDAKVEFDKVVTLPKFDIIVSPSSVHISHDWKWTLESIVFHRSCNEDKKDMKKEMHDAMSNYLKMAKNEKTGMCIG